jgi:hypothetical protein
MEMFMKVVLQKMSFMEMVFIDIIISLYFKVNGNLEKRMGLVNMKELIDIFKLVLGKMISFKFEFI